MPPLLALVRGQATAIATLERARKSGRVASAYLFDGPVGVGKELAAFGLAQALLCAAPTENGLACGNCSPCSRAVPQGEQRVAKHPDIIVLQRGLYAPEQIGRRTPENQDLSIDQVRTLVLTRFAFPPHEGRARIFVIRDADEMNASAANALLKVLEEPGNDTHFILITSRPDALLPTIRSRTLRVRFGPLPLAVLKELLVGKVPAGQEAKTAELARGSMAVALSLANEEDMQRKATFVDRATTALAAATLREAFELGEEAKKTKDGLETLLEALAARFWEDGRRAGGDARKNARRYGEVLRTLRELDGNASPQLATESLLMRLRVL